MDPQVFLYVGSVLFAKLFFRISERQFQLGVIIVGNGFYLANSSTNVN